MLQQPVENNTASFPILTRELACAIEDFIAPGLNVPGENYNPAIPVVARFGNTIASKARGGKPSNKVFCFGHDDIKHLPGILAFYAEDDLQPWFYLSPMRFTADAGAALAGAGFVQQDFQQAILYRPTLAEPMLLPPDITIERVTTDNLDVYVQTMAAGFEWPDEWRDNAIEDARTKFKPESYQFLSRWNGRPAGTGSINIRNGMVGLGGGSVVPELRGKGCHLAMVYHRLHIASQLGYTIAIGGAFFGSGSFRNQQRAGFRLAYIESGWCRV